MIAFRQVYSWLRRHPKLIPNISIQICLVLSVSICLCCHQFYQKCFYHFVSHEYVLFNMIFVFHLCHMHHVLFIFLCSVAHSLLLIITVKKITRCIYTNANMCYINLSEQSGLLKCINFLFLYII